MKIEGFEQLLKTTEKNIIIFGAGQLGEMIAKTCCLNNIKVDGFCDNDNAKHGQIKDGLLITSLKDIRDRYENTIFIISPENKEIQKIFVDKLKELDFKHWYFCYDFFYNIKILYDENESVEKKIHYSKVKINAYRDESNIEHNKELLIFGVELLVTEKCTLKCMDCSNLMQYYKKPIDCKKEDLFLYIDKLDEIFDEIQVLRILGGEPFIRNDIYDIVIYAQKKSNIKYIEIVTNGTILLDEEKIKEFDKSKLLIHISNYGELAPNRDTLSNSLENAGIEYVIRNFDYWLESANILNYNYDTTELDEVYKTCNTAKNCNTISNGNLYICPYLAHAHRLKAVPEENFEMIDIMNETIPTDILKSQIYDFLYRTKHFKGCNYCAGRDLEFTKKVPVARQIKEPRIYTMC